MLVILEIDGDELLMHSAFASFAFAKANFSTTIHQLFALIVSPSAEL
ncbi:hypothetical protein [Nonlabens agnitus]|nr:hypothetical protein [Nonlabens agnitus]